jgi:hypothetical protein
VRRIYLCGAAAAALMLLLTIVLAGLGSAEPAVARATPTTIASLEGNTSVGAYGGVVAWNDYDATARAWHVVVRRNGQISTTAVPAASEAIEVAVGPGPSGSPILGYRSCIDRCHLVVSAVDGSDPRAVPGTDGASHPTVWGSRVAWVSGAAKVMTSRLSGADRRVLGGVPRRKC